MSNIEKSNVTLELSDIIQVISPINPDVNDKVFIIKYIDNNVIKLINTETTDELVLNINDDGTLEEDYIAEIHLLDRSEKKGYAKQNNLLIDSWIDIHFIGDLHQPMHVWRDEDRGGNEISFKGLSVNEVLDESGAQDIQASVNLAPFDQDLLDIRHAG